MRKLVLTGLVLVVAGGLSLAAAQAKAETKEVSGVVKSLTQDSITVTKDNQEWTFVVDNDTQVVGKGGTHAMKALDAAGKKATITDFIRKDQQVTVQYLEKEGKLHASKVTVANVAPPK